VVAAGFNAVLGDETTFHPSLVVSEDNGVTLRKHPSLIAVGNASQFAREHQNSKGKGASLKIAVTIFPPKMENTIDNKMSSAAAALAAADVLFQRILPADSRTRFRQLGTRDGDIGTLCSCAFSVRVLTL